MEISRSGLGSLNTEVTRILDQMHRLTQEASQPNTGSVVQSPLKTVDAVGQTHAPFHSVFQQVTESLNSVNTAQNQTEGLKASYLVGDQSVSLSDVVLAAQKSDLAFQGLVAVRNKLLQAYNDVMNMPT